MLGSMNKTLCCALIISASSLLVACSSDGTDNAQPSTVVVTQTVPADPSAKTPVQPGVTGFERSPDNKTFTDAQLRELWVPALCGNEAGKLADGKLLPPAKVEDVPNKQAFMQSREDGSVMGAYTDINGDGKDEAIVSYYCDMGGVSWPNTLLIYDNDLNYLNKVEAADMAFNGFHVQRAHIKELQWDESKVYVQWLGWTETDAACCASGILNGELTMKGGVPVLSNVTDSPNF